MLDNETKRRIDTARDILVGKVPDPKSQVEQITIALIYKFMDDMDAEAEELGGERTFFSGDFAKYSWVKLMAPGMGGFEVLNLYAEAITKMDENAGIPLLFREIFKNAYLPYRDPETLKSFLKVIDDFTYDHSERLGDAFEYLLSVLGSQGDAGQFRTPRHIIDFMVKVIDPQKQESILDPACGTAGFLVSAYKHVMAANTKNGRPGAALTPDERTRMLNNIIGYDISPDMVRLSLVNLYLHGFSDPHIFEYDTLTSEDRWNEYYDIIMANPPFMSPKGGIRPHRRFSVQSKRSEVLFVDYIAEHLSPNGRAAVIVPEGIIFQSSNAYKQLRRMLVDEYLVGVISLPAGVFNPYSGVKTSILWLDKALSKQTDQIAFVKIENDGFGLGAQRRAIKLDDLPAALSTILDYKSSVVDGTDFDAGKHHFFTAVNKDLIAENGDYNLSGERYQIARVINTNYPLVELQDVAYINPSKREVYNLDQNLDVSFIPMADLNENQIGFVPKQKKQLGKVLKGYTYFQNDDVLLAKITPCFENGKAGLAKKLINGIGFGSTEYYVIRANEKIIPELVYYYLTTPKFREQGKAMMTGSAGQQRVPKSFVQTLRIPLPPLAVQEEIVAEVEGYQKIIDGARQVVENYRPRIPINPDWPLVELKELSKLTYGYTDSAQASGDARFIRITDIDENGELRAGGAKYIKLTEEAKKYLLKKADLVVARTGATYGKTLLFSANYPAVYASYLIKIDLDSSRILPKYYWVFTLSDEYDDQKSRLVTGGGQPQFNAKAIQQIKVPLPDTETQGRIIIEIDQELALVQANRQLITRFEQKIRDRIARVWGEV